MSAAMSEHGDQLKQEVGEVAQTAKEQVVELRETARSRVDEEVDRRRVELGSGARRMADATRETGHQLRDEGKDLPAMLIERAAVGIDRAASYLERTDAEQLWVDARELGRRMPWVFMLAGGVVGLAASRVIKAAGSDEWAGNRPMMGSPGWDDAQATVDVGAIGTADPEMTPGGFSTTDVMPIPDAPGAVETPSRAKSSGVTGS